MTDPGRFWQEALARDGPIEVWVIQGERYLHNGNHRFHAAVQAGVGIPADHIRIMDKTGSQIPTFRFADLTWLSGTK